MSQQQEVNLRPVWDAILDIYKEIAKICERHGIRHWAAAGTLLGAVRHKGFIPWDDDFDLHMPRKDYDRFIDLAQKELPPYLKIVSRSNTASYDWNFIKVQDTRRDVYDRVVKQTGVVQEQGLYVDIFPLYGVSSSRLYRMYEQLKFLLVATRMTRVLRSGRHSSVKGWVAEFFGMLLGGLFRHQKTNRDFVNLIENWNERLAFDEAKLVSLFWPQLMNWEWIAPRSAFDETVFLPFMDITIPCPRGYHDTLTAHYGDYMKLPPVEARKSCHNGWGDVPWKFGPAGL